MPALPVSRMYCFSHSIFCVAAGQVQRDLFDVAVVVVRDVPDLQPRAFHALLDRQKVVERGRAVAGLNVQILDAHLLDPGQVLFGVRLRPPAWRS